MNPERLDWHEDAACRGVDPDIFFPIAEDDAWRAKEICRSCACRSACLVFSLENHERYGVWGGLTEKERAETFRRGHARRLVAQAIAG